MLGSCNRDERAHKVSSLVEGSKKQLVDDAALRVGDGDRRNKGSESTVGSGIEGCLICEEEACDADVVTESAWIEREE